MDASVISAVAALAGTAVGGLTSVLANLLTHRIQVRAQWLQHEKNRRQVLSRLYRRGQQVLHRRTPAR